MNRVYFMVHKTMTFSRLADIKFRTGDIILFSSSVFYEFSLNPISHVGIIIRLNNEYCLYDLYPGYHGPRISIAHNFLYRKLLENRAHKIFVRHIQSSGTDRDLEDVVRKTKNVRYSVNKQILEYFNSSTVRFDARKEYMNCAQFVLLCLQYMGLAYPTNIHFNTILPHDFSSSRKKISSVFTHTYYEDSQIVL